MVYNIYDVHCNIHMYTEYVHIYIYTCIWLNVPTWCQMLAHGHSTAEP